MYVLFFKIFCSTHWMFIVPLGWSSSPPRVLKDPFDPDNPGSNTVLPVNYIFLSCLTDATITSCGFFPCQMKINTAKYNLRMNVFFINSSS